MRSCDLDISYLYSRPSRATVFTQSRQHALVSAGFSRMSVIEYVVGMHVNHSRVVYWNRRQTAVSNAYRRSAAAGIAGRLDSWG